VTPPAAQRLDIPFIDELGIELQSATAGRAVLLLDLQPKHLNSWQVAHGGVLMSLLDVAMSLAGRTLFDGAGGATVDLTTSFLQPAAAGARLTVAAQAYHRAGSIAFCEATVREGEEKLIARGMGTFKYRTGHKAF
jgi:acyl-CoA thioesterase